MSLERQLESTAANGYGTVARTRPQLLIYFRSPDDTALQT